VKRLDRIIDLNLKELPIHLPSPEKTLLENVNEPHPQIVLLKAQHVQTFVVTLRITTLTPSSIRSKKEASLEEILSKIAV